MSRESVDEALFRDEPNPGQIGPKPDGDGWYKCGCHCHTAAKKGLKVYHCIPCCSWGWKQWVTKAVA
jgi:hypothetical protein